MLRNRCITAAAIAATAGLAGTASSEIVVTEIFYNPAGSETPGEWIEIYNSFEDVNGNLEWDPGVDIGEAIDISGWTFNDTQDSQFSDPLPDGTIIQPGEAFVLVVAFDIEGFLNNVRVGAADAPLVNIDIVVSIDEDDFVAAWGEHLRGKVFFTTSDDIPTWANSASATNDAVEIASIDRRGLTPPGIGGDQFTVDLVNYETNRNSWPSTTEIRGAGGQTIYLRGVAFNNPSGTPSELNDFGGAWLSSGPTEQADPMTGVINSTRVTQEIRVLPVLDDEGQPVFDGAEQLFFLDPSGEPVFDTNGDPVNPAEKLSGIDPSDPEGPFTDINWGSPGFVDIRPLNFDCNANGIDDFFEIAFFSGVEDCDGDGVLDECAINEGGGTNGIGGPRDLDNNGRLDDCQIAELTERDCNRNNVLDAIDIQADPLLDVDGDGFIDDCGRNTVIISEIQYDPATNPELEYIELLNLTSADIDLTGWQIVDRDNPDEISDPFPAGTILPANGTIVLIEPGDENGGDETDDATAEFFALYGATNIDGDPIVVAEIPGFEARSNGARNDNEVLTIQNALGFVVDEANFSAADSSGGIQLGWPGDVGGPGGPSIYLSAESVSSADPAGENNEGTNWRLHINGLDGAVQTNELDLALFDRTGADIGSPGFVRFGTSERPTGEVIITEIAYATNSVGAQSPSRSPLDDGFNGAEDEFVEIYNTTPSTVDLSGWFLQDEDGFTTAFPAGTELAPGEIAVVISVDTRGVSNGLTGDFADNRTPRSSMYSAYPGDYQVILVNGLYDGSDDSPFGLSRLSNGPSALNEILRLVRADGRVSDVANFNVEANDPFIDPWPAAPLTDPGVSSYSIFLLPGRYDEDSNDSGQSWAASTIPVPTLFDSLADGDTTRANDFTLDGTTPDVDPGSLPAAIINPVYNGFFYWSSPGTLQNVRDVFDLGSSPTFATGACCLAAAGCVANTEEAACLVAGGTYLGDDMFCDDINGDGATDFVDVIQFLGLAEVGDLAADFDGDSDVDDLDVTGYLDFIATGGGCGF